MQEKILHGIFATILFLKAEGGEEEDDDDNTTKVPFQRPDDRQNVRMRSADFRLTANESLEFQPELPNYHISPSP